MITRIILFVLAFAFIHAAKVGTVSNRADELLFSRLIDRKPIQETAAATPSTREKKRDVRKERKKCKKEENKREENEKKESVGTVSNRANELLFSRLVDRKPLPETLASTVGTRANRRAGVHERKRCNKKESKRDKNEKKDNVVLNRKNETISPVKENSRDLVYCVLDDCYVYGFEPYAMKRSI